MSAGDERPRFSHDAPRGEPSDGLRPATNSLRDQDARPPLETDWWRESPREVAPQWSLAELFVLTTGAAATASACRLVSPIAWAAVAGVCVILGWMRLALDDWEPRWAVIAWRTVLASYLTSMLFAILRAG